MTTHGQTHPHELISALLDGEITKSERAEVNAHLASCSECRALADDLRVLGAALAAEQPPPVPATLASRIGRNLKSASFADSPVRLRRGWYTSWPPLAAGSLAAAGLLAFILLREGIPREAAISPGQPEPTGRPSSTERANTPAHQLSGPRGAELPADSFRKTADREATHAVPPDSSQEARDRKFKSEAGVVQAERRSDQRSKEDRGVPAAGSSGQAASDRKAIGLASGVPRAEPGSDSISSGAAGKLAAASPRQVAPAPHEAVLRLEAGGGEGRPQPALGGKLAGAPKPEADVNEARSRASKLGREQDQLKDSDLPASAPAVEDALELRSPSCRAVWLPFRAPVILRVEDSGRSLRDIQALIRRLGGTLTNPSTSSPLWKIEIPPARLQELLSALRRMGADQLTPSAAPTDKMDCVRVDLRFEARAAKGPDERP